MVLFGRVAKLIIQTPDQDNTDYVNRFEIQDLRVSFSVMKSLQWSGNSAIIKVWGLKQSTRNLIKEYGTQVQLYAGYEQDAGTQLLFIGQTIAVYHTYEQPEIISTFECIDGDKYFNQAKGSVSYAPGTLAKTVIEDLASKTGVKLASFNAPQNLQYQNGFSFTGSLREGIFKACDFLNLQATIQNNILYVVPIKGITPEPIYEINENTGMHGIPERYTYRRLWQYRAVDRPQVGFRITNSLFPLIKPFDHIRLTSTHLQIVQKPCRVESVRHMGDNYGAEWATHIEVTELPPPPEVTP